MMIGITAVPICLRQDLTRLKQSPYVSPTAAQPGGHGLSHGRTLAGLTAGA